MTERYSPTRWWLPGVAAFAFVAALAGLWAPSTYGARTSADEPQYLLTAISLFEDLDLDINDELASRRYRPFHEIPLDPQTRPLDESGRQVSPHDPLLPALLAVPVAAGGWVGAKLALAAIGACAAALTAGLAHHRFGVSRRTAAVVTVAGFGALPLAPYGTQVYPELAAALTLLVGVTGLTTRSGTARDRHRGSMITLVAITILPWLAVKYVPVAAALGIALIAKLRDHRRDLLAAMAIVAVAGITYVLAHRWLYGGWTVYAAGDHFVSDGEFSVVGTEVDLLGRSRRLVGLLVDRQFGIAAWSPVWILLPIAGVSALRSRVPAETVLAAIVGLTWLNASFVALTMHGWWVPGRQLVVALPVALILLACWVEEHPTSRTAAVAGLGFLGIVNWLWLAFEATTGQRTLIVDFARTTSLPYRGLRNALPEGTAVHTTDDLLLALWGIALVGAALTFGLRRPERMRQRDPQPARVQSRRSTYLSAGNPSIGRDPARQRSRDRPVGSGAEGE